MNAARAATTQHNAQTAKVSASAPSALPLKPRRGLLILCTIIFGIWVAGMIAMYFQTVYPHRHRALTHTVETSAPLPR